MTAPKLTEAQRKHLTEMERRSAQHAFSGFDFPSLTVGQFKKLGYIAPVKIATSTYYHVTPAGRAALRGEVVTAPKLTEAQRRHCFNGLQCLAPDSCICLCAPGRSL